jgi:hypothetical protein
MKRTAVTLAAASAKTYSTMLACSAWLSQCPWIENGFVAMSHTPFHNRCRLQLQHR